MRRAENVRRYNDIETRTELVHSTHRLVKARRITGMGSLGTRQAQARGGRVKPFVPDCDKFCCSRMCASFFDDSTDERVAQAREPLLDANLARADMRTLLFENADTLLLHPRDNKPVCVNCLCVLFSCSKSFLYPNNNRTQGTQGDSNARRTKIRFSVMKWFEKEKETADVMPDDGRYQLAYPRKSFVYDLYCTDVQEVTACTCALSMTIVGNCGCPLAKPVFLECSISYFTKVWDLHFKDCVLRKYCRFAKCSFCLKYKAIKNDRKKSLAERNQAKSLLLGHRKVFLLCFVFFCFFFFLMLLFVSSQFVYEERAVEHSRRMKSILEPRDSITIAMDGTDQAVNGLPQFRQQSKDDHGKVRLRHHFEVVQVAGTPDSIYVYVKPEDIPGDPNVTVEVLQRTLKAEEKRRSTLPATLNLQLDNCRAANKNSVFFSYLAWLVQRGVFTLIYVSFFPVGHTHFGPDRISSRISVCVRMQDIFSLEDLLQRIRQSHTPAPKTEVIDRVADYRKLVNPNKCAAYTGARIVPLRGLCTKRPAACADQAIFIGETSSLHFRFCMDDDGNVVIQDRQTQSIPDWSPVAKIWNDKFRDSDSREHMDGQTSMTLEDLQIAPNQPLSETRQKEIRGYIHECDWRIPENYKAGIQTLLDSVTTLRTHNGEELHWEDGGYFKHEDADMDDEDPDDETHRSELILPQPQNSIIPSLSEQNDRRGVVSTVHLHVGEFIAYKPVYNDNIPEAERRPFWLGKITELHADKASVQVRTYYTPSATPLKSNNTMYKKWTGRCQYMDVSMANIFVMVDSLTQHSRLKAKYKKRITAVLTSRLLNARHTGDTFTCASG